MNNEIKIDSFIPRKMESYLFADAAGYMNQVQDNQFVSSLFSAGLLIGVIVFISLVKIETILLSISLFLLVTAMLSFCTSIFTSRNALNSFRLMRTNLNSNLIPVDPYLSFEQSRIYAVWGGRLTGFGLILTGMGIISLVAKFQVIVALMLLPVTLGLIWKYFWIHPSQEKAEFLKKQLFLRELWMEKVLQIVKYFSQKVVNLQSSNQKNEEALASIVNKYIQALQPILVHLYKIYPKHNAKSKSFTDDVKGIVQQASDIFQKLCNQQITEEVFFYQTIELLF